MFAGCLLAFAELVVEALAEQIDQRIDRSRRRRALGSQSRILAQLYDHVHDFGNMLLREENGFHHVLFRHLAGEALDHGDRIARAGDDQVELALFKLRVRGHQHEVIVDAADAHRGCRLLKRNVRHVQRGAGADHRQDIRVVFLVGR